jgi:hypothetical protein
MHALFIDKKKDLEEEDYCQNNNNVLYRYKAFKGKADIF